MSPLNFHPVIEDWFRSRFDGPTEPQIAGLAADCRGKERSDCGPDRIGEGRSRRFWRASTGW